MRDSLNVEREQWLAELRRQKDLELAERERQCREESRIERDKQIEMVITRLTDETSQAKSEMEMAANTKMRWVESLSMQRSLQRAKPIFIIKQSNV